MRQIYCDRVGCQMLQLIPSATSRSRPGASSLHSRTSIYLSLLMRDSNPWPRGGSSVLSRQYGSVAKMSLPGLMCMKLLWKSAIYKHIVLRWHCPVALQVCGHVLFAQARMAPLRCRQIWITDKFCNGAAAAASWIVLENHISSHIWPGQGRQFFQLGRRPTIGCCFTYIKCSWATYRYRYRWRQQRPRKGHYWDDKLLSGNCGSLSPQSTISYFLLVAILQFY